MVRLAGAMRRVNVADVLQQVISSAGFAQITDASHHVEQRLGGQTRNRGRPNVVNTADQPRCQRFLKLATLVREQLRPERVIRNHADTRNVHDPHRKRERANSRYKSSSPPTETPGRAPPGWVNGVVVASWAKPRRRRIGALAGRASTCT